jgi:hypothetical protein
MFVVETNKVKPLFQNIFVLPCERQLFTLAIQSKQRFVATVDEPAKKSDRRAGVSAWLGRL